MTVTLPDGRLVIWSPRSPHLSGDPELVAEVRAWLTREWVQAATPGSREPLLESNQGAAFMAMWGVAQGAGQVDPARVTSELPLSIWPPENPEVGHAIDGIRWDGSIWVAAGAEGVASVPARQDDPPREGPGSRA